MEKPKIIIFTFSLFGAIAGILFTVIANPTDDYLNWIVIFPIIGIIVANLILLIVYGVSKSPRQ
jgi:hypothetical protein